MPQQEKGESGLKGMAATLGRSAEYSIALGLVVVCLVVGGALWFLDGGGESSSGSSTSAPDTSQDSSRIAEEERKALEGYNQQLQGNFKEIEEQAQRRAADEAAQRDRQRQEAERVAEADRQRARAAAAAALPVATAAPAATRAPAPATTAPVRRAAVRVDPAIDWSTCRRPEYPDSSVKRKEQGTVSVDVEVDASGKALSSKIGQSSGYSKLDTVTQRAVERCRFSPATVDGKPEASTATVRFTWQLN